jgi:hypothetical protein
MSIETGAATEGAISDGKETKGREEIDQTVHQEESGQEVDQEAFPEEEGRQAVGEEAVHQEARHKAAARRGSRPDLSDRTLGKTFDLQVELSSCNNEYNRLAARPTRRQPVRFGRRSRRQT